MNKRLLGLGCLLCVLWSSVSVLSDTPRQTFDQLDASINGGDGYKFYNNENATLAWGESYIMMSYAIMYEGTRDRYYLDKLADHADHVMVMRDDFRGVTDYRGVSMAAWRNRHYQPNQEPYCYVVHSGMITFPIARFVEFVYMDTSIWELTTYDGSTYKEKADWFLARVEETVASHADQWADGPSSTEGYYFFRTDAVFLAYPGRDLPLNQQNAMGRTLICLSRVSPNGDYYDKASRLAQYFKNNLTTDASGAYVWNYWGGAYTSPGEDVSHAAINVDFAIQCYLRGVVFDRSDMTAFIKTFTSNVNQDVNNSVGNVGGGTLNTYREQLGRWGGLARFDPAVYAYLRNNYDRQPVSGAGRFVGFANMVLWELPELPFDFYSLSEWSDQGTYMQGISSSPNFQYHAADRNEPGVMRLAYSTDQIVSLQQYGPGPSPVYRDVVKLADTNTVQDYCYFTYNPAYYYSYSSADVLYQLYNGNGTRIYRAGSSIGTPLPTVTPAPSPTPIPSRYNVLRFEESDSRYQALAGYHYLDVLLNNRVIYSVDVGWAGDVAPEIAIGEDDLWPGDQNVLVFRLRENHGVSNYSITVTIRNIVLMRDGLEVPLPQWVYSETNPVFSTSGPVELTVPSSTPTGTGDFCQYGSIAWVPTPTPTPTPTMTSTNTATPTMTPTPTMTNTATQTPTRTPTSTPTPTDTPTPTVTPTWTPTETPTPTDTPTNLPTNTPDTTPTPVCAHTGDVDGSGSVSSGDAQAAFYIAIGSYQPTPVEWCAADCNGDGVVSAGDAQMIFYAGLGIGSCQEPLF